MDDDMPPEATTAISLPEDVVFEILSRTPVKSACRFQCVSKGWRGLISSPAFLAAHKSRHNEPFLVYTGHFRGNKERADLRFMDMDGKVVKIIEGVGGLKMLPTTSLDDLVFVSNGSYHGANVVDPATGEVLFTGTGLKVHNMLFTAYPYEAFAIGRATPSGVYKVVRFVRDEIACDVLTLGDANTGWRRKAQTKLIRQCVLDMLHSPVTIDGDMYFLTKKTSSGDILICFDLEKEQWKDDPIIGPREIKDTGMVRITEPNGALCMVQEEEREDWRGCQNPCTNIWILDDSDKSNWIKAYTIRKGTIGRRYIPLRVLHGGEKLLVQYIPRDIGSSPALQVYDPYRETCMNIKGTPDYLRGPISLCRLHLEHLMSVTN